MILGLDSDKDPSEERYAKEQQRQTELGEIIQLIFRLPGGEEHEKQFRTGHSIQYVKAVLHHDLGLPMTMVLTCNEKKLIDPLSISDCSSILLGRANIVTVQV